MYDIVQIPDTGPLAAGPKCFVWARPDRRDSGH